MQMTLTFYHFLKENKETAKPFVGKIHINFEKEFEVPVLPSP